MQSLGPLLQSWGIVIIVRYYQVLLLFFLIIIQLITNSLKMFLVFSFHQAVVGDFFQTFLGRVGKYNFYLEVSHVSSSSSHITEPKCSG